MSVIKFYKADEVSSWLRDAGIQEEKINSFLPIFSDWKNTTNNLSVFNYSFFSGSYNTEVCSIDDTHVIKGTQKNNIEILERKIEYYTSKYDISKDIFLPVYCLELEKEHTFTDDFYTFREEYKKRLNNSVPKKETRSFNCLVIQDKAVPMMDLQYKIRTENADNKDISLLNVNLHNLGLLNDKLVLFDW